jgi:hypothetical protein
MMNCKGCGSCYGLIKVLTGGTKENLGKPQLG